MRDVAFPGGPVIKNLSASAGDLGMIPGPGRSHVLWGNQACVRQLLNLRSRARELQLLKPTFLDPALYHTRGHGSKKSVHHK